LVQRAVEKRGIPTISPTVAMDITLHIKPPRAMFLPFMMGHHFGVPYHYQLQKAIVLRLLNLVTEIESSETIPVFEKTWAEARKEGKVIEASKQHI